MTTKTSDLIQSLKDAGHPLAEAARRLRRQQEQIAHLREMLDVTTSCVELNTGNGAQTNIPERFFSSPGDVNFQSVANSARVTLQMTQEALS